VISRSGRDPVEPAEVRPLSHEASEAAPSSPPRVVIEDVRPEVGAGRHPVKRSVGNSVAVSAAVFAEGHDRVAAALRFRREGDGSWQEERMVPSPEGRWEARFTVEAPGRYQYTLEAWVDRFASWREAIEKKLAAEQDVESELLEGAALVREVSAPSEADAKRLEGWAGRLAGAGPPAARAATALDPALLETVQRCADRRGATRYERVLEVLVERERARSGAWYEFFPRSCSKEPGRHGTFRDAEARLADVASMGFDVVYLPPIHPIGRTHRKGPNNRARGGRDDPGSPWAIGSEEGGHKAVHPALGSLADFDRLVEKARELGLEIALDIAFQCSPDHPYVTEHPEWFHHRPDGSIHFAENPPKKYQDIYPLNFECENWRELWEELKSVVLFWIGHGVSIFRVDNPHTKPFAFWEWLIREVRASHPEVVFLSEAFTRPSVLHYLAKIGFSQSYGYFTWRNTKWELTSYFTELSSYPSREYLHMNLFANTPDILHAYLQTGTRVAFQVRAALAATLSSSYGIYGPAFELCESEAIPGTEEYRDSEKYQIRHWDLERPGHIRDWITRLNEIRRAQPALRAATPPRFLAIDNEELLAYARIDGGLDEAVIVVVNLDPHHLQAGWLELPLEEFNIDPGGSFQAHDLLGGGRYLWHGHRSYVALDPAAAPAHVFRLRRRIRTERDFDYYL
jgi:starch synthase (maltosyl-transferring)